MSISYHHDESDEIALPDNSFVHFETSAGQFTVGLNDEGEFKVFTSRPMAILPTDVGEFVFTPVAK